MLHMVEKTLRTEGIIPKYSVLIALSGGADSVALLSIMCGLAQKYNYKVYAAHVNHGLRAEAANSDEEFSKKLCARMGVELFVKHTDIRAEAERWGISEELAGRRVRYSFFEKIMDEYQIEYTATAHHKNDNAETIIMNFMRGSGIKGLCGIPYRRGRIIRPLLDISRRQIERYCYDNGLDYVTDATNLQTIYTRNKIRHILLPLIEQKFNPSVTETITANAKLFAYDEDFINREAEKAAAKLVSLDGVDTAKLCSMHKAIALRVIRHMFSAVCGTEDISLLVSENIFRLAANNKTGTRIDIARGAYAEIKYGKLVISNKQKEKAAKSFCYDLSIGQSRYIPELDCSILVEECSCGGRDCFTIPPNARLQIRSRRSGDVFYPQGMSGKKKIKDFFINEKIPREERDRVGLVTADEQIAWVVGYRRDRRFDFCEQGVKISVLY